MDLEVFSHLEEARWRRILAKCFQQNYYHDILIALALINID
jgi:hypothetical protein